MVTSYFSAVEVPGKYPSATPPSQVLALFNMLVSSSLSISTFGGCLNDSLCPALLSDGLISISSISKFGL